jgi:hypothetical protein
MPECARVKLNDCSGWTYGTLAPQDFGFQPVSPRGRSPVGFPHQPEQISKWRIGGSDARNVRANRELATGKELGYY